MRLFGTPTSFFEGLLLASTGILACDTEAVGVDSCRKVEYSRCDAASRCPNTFGAIDPAACRRFYRDHCLHGLPGPDPGVTKVTECVNMIADLGECAARGQDMTLADCSLTGTSVDPEILTACSLIAQPEKILTCAPFLNPPGTDAGK